MSACSPNLDWREVRPPNAQGLSVILPCKPETQSREVHLPAMGSSKFTMHVLSCQADGTLWALSYLDTQTPQAWLRAPAALSDALWGNVSLGQSTAALRKDLGGVNVPGMTPHPQAHTWWMQGQRPVSTSQSESVQVRSWLFTKGLHVFQASAWQATLPEDDPRLTTFAAGFNFSR